ncbi:MAG: glutamate 5-kinase, partial [Myxococcales bacterium]
KTLIRARRVVVKIGSSSLTVDDSAAARLAEEVASLVAKGYSFVIVTSGAIAIGCGRLGYRTKPKEMARLQAAAAAGQSILMRRYDEAFASVGVTAAQVLLTHADLAERERANNARQALAALLEAGAVPIINENDTVATDEIRFGDNDQLSAMVAPLVGAEIVILLTDVEGVLDDKGKRISVLREDSSVGTVARSGASLGTGGMASKINAARKGARSGANVVIASARKPKTITQVLSGEDVGTLVPVSPHALRARKHWIAYTLRPKGAVLLDSGAVKVVSGGKSSLLPVGVLGVRGDFHPGDAVSLVDSEGREIGRGLSRLAAAEVARSAGKKGESLEQLFGERAKDLVVVHKDDLVTDL